MQFVNVFVTSTSYSDRAVDRIQNKNIARLYINRRNSKKRIMLEIDSTKEMTRASRILLNKSEIRHKNVRLAS